MIRLEMSFSKYECYGFLTHSDSYCSFIFPVDLSMSLTYLGVDD